MKTQRIAEMQQKADAARVANDYPRAIAWMDAIEAAISGPREREWKAYSVADGLELNAGGNSLVKRYVSSAERTQIDNPR